MAVLGLKYSHRRRLQRKQTAITRGLYAACMKNASQELPHYHYSSALQELPFVRLQDSIRFLSFVRFRIYLPKKAKSMERRAWRSATPEFYTRRSHFSNFNLLSRIVNCTLARALTFKKKVVLNSVSFSKFVTKHAKQTTLIFLL